VTLKDNLRFRVYHRLRYSADLLRSNLTRKRPGRTLSILLVSDGAVYTSEQQFAALHSYRNDLRRRLGIALDQKPLTDVLAASSQSLRRYNVVLLKLSFRTNEANAVGIVQRLRSKCPFAKFIYCDGDDDACVAWAGVLAQVDLYVKKQIFSRCSDYQHQFVGKSNLTEYIARTHGGSFENNIIPNSGTIDPRDQHKLALGYNIGLDDKIVRLFRESRIGLAARKDTDIVCRAACPPDSWIYPFRGPISSALSALKDRYRILLPDQRVTQAQYYDEMRRSRICVSPFGYGEVCWRDFEAVILGCLLIKPDMSHLRTEPNIFVPGETYVPVKWDFSDLATTCAQYLSDEAAMNRITKRAYEVLAEYYDRHKIVDCFQRLLKRVDIKT
jgi:hypothetical protein